MKKLLCLIAVIALTAPVMAAEGDPNVAVTCDETGLVSYEVLIEDGVDPGLMRGIALNITTSNGALITDISQYDAEGATPPDIDSENIPAGYPIYMGSLIFATDPNLVSDFGDPIAPNTDPDALGGLGTTGITVEMGSLYADGDPAPAAAGVLFKLDIDLNGETDTVLTIAANTTRGGCVMEGGSTANVVSAGCTIGGVCFVGTPAEVAAWNTWGNPPNWCGDCWRQGDIDADCLITFGGDVLTVFADLKNPTSPGALSGRSDYDMDGLITFGGDFLGVFGEVKSGTICPTPCVPLSLP